MCDYVENKTIGNMGAVWVLVAREVAVRASIVNPNPEPATTTIETWHTYDCLLSQARYNAEVELYKNVWPGFCSECNGWGGRWISFDPSPAGVSLSPGSMEDFEPCYDCLCPEDWQEARCPRCGVIFASMPIDEDFVKEVGERLPEGGTITGDELLEAWVDALVNEYMSCSNCGWNNGVSKHDGIHEGPECACWCLDDNPGGAA